MKLLKGNKHLLWWSATSSTEDRPPLGTQCSLNPLQMYSTDNTTTLRKWL